MPKLSSFRIISEDTQLWLFPILFIFLKPFIILVTRPVFAFYLTVPPAFWILILSSYYKEITFKWSTKVFLGDKNKWFCHHSAYLSNDPCGTVRVVPWKTILKADMRRAARVDESPSIKSCPTLYEHGFFVKTPRKNENSNKKKVFSWIVIFLFWLEKNNGKVVFCKIFLVVVPRAPVHRVFIRLKQNFSKRSHDKMPIDWVWLDKKIFFSQPWRSNRVALGPYVRTSSQIFSRPTRPSSVKKYVYMYITFTWDGEWSLERETTDVSPFSPQRQRSACRSRANIHTLLLVIYFKNPDRNCLMHWPLSS